MVQPVLYYSDYLLLRIHTDNPAAIHELLMKGVNDAIQYYMTHPDKQSDSEGLLALLQLQKVLIPTQKKLEEAYQR